MKRTSLFLLSLLVALGVPACSDDDDGGGAVVDPTQGVVFSSENAEHLAGAVISALDLFPGLNGVYFLLVDAVDNHGFFEGEPMPEDGYELRDLGLCADGQGVGTWMDADDSKTLTAGDTVRLELADCDDRTNGTVDLSFNTVDPTHTEVDLELDLAFVTTLRDTFETETMVGRFELEVDELTEPTAGIVFSYDVSDPSDGGAGLTGTFEGETIFQMGCFHLYYSMNPATGAYVLSEPFAVFRAPGYGVMTMASDGMADFEYPGGATPNRGQTRLSSGTGVTPCMGLDIPGSGVSANCSCLTITVVDRSAVTLTGEDEEGAFYLVTTTWADLH